MISKVVNVGDLCVFEVKQGQWSIGKVLQFAKLPSGTQPYKHLCVDLSTKGMGVLCSWFEPQEDSTRLFKLFGNTGLTHTYIPLSTYVCT